MPIEVRHEDGDLKVNFNETYSSEKLYVFDGLFNLSEKTHIWNIVRNAFFKIGDDMNSKRYMKSEFDYREAAATNIIRKLQKTTASKLLYNTAFERCIVTLDSYASIHTLRTVPGYILAQYYVNLEWDDNFGGESSFYNNDDSLMFSSQYVPGRCLVFDGDLPHSFKPFTIEAPQHRFIVTFYYRKPMPTDDDLIAAGEQ